MLRAMETNKSVAQTYSMSLIEIELFARNKETEEHSYHPELEKKIEELGSIMKQQEEAASLTIEEYLDGVLEKKLIEFGEARVKREIEAFDDALKDAFIKEEKRLTTAPGPDKMARIRKEEYPETIVEGCKVLKRGEKLGRSFFSSLMLYDSYKFATTGQGPLEFLTHTYAEHVIKGKALEMVRAYAVTKSMGMSRLEMYENRYMYAELYQYVRGGLYSEATKFLEENKNFFWLISNNFYSSFMHWMQALGLVEGEKKYSWEWEEVPEEVDDSYKMLFYRLFTGNGDCPKEVIGTIEDFLWYQILVKKTVKDLRIKGSVQSDAEIFEVLEGSVSAAKLLQAALILKQWKKAMMILQNEAFKAGEILFLSHAISQKSKEHNPHDYPVKRERAQCESAECINLLVRMVQGVSSLFAKPLDKLCIVNVVHSFVIPEWFNELVAEVFISSEDYSVLGGVDKEGRRDPPVIQEYVDVTRASVIQKVSEYYMYCGELDKALKVSYIGGSKNTIEILKNILVDKIHRKDYLPRDLEPMVKHFSNTNISFLWEIIVMGGSKHDSIALIRRSALLPDNTPLGLIRKLEELQKLPPDIQGVIPCALVIISRRLKEHPHKENQDLAKSLLLLAGGLLLDNEILYEIISGISAIL